MFVLAVQVIAPPSAEFSPISFSPMLMFAQSIPLYGTRILLLTKGPKGTPNGGKKGEREAIFYLYI